MVLELQISETSRSVTHQFKEFVFRTAGATHVWNFIFAEALNPLTRFNPEMATDLSGAGFYARMEIARSTNLHVSRSRFLFPGSGRFIRSFFMRNRAALPKDLSWFRHGWI